MREQRQAGAGLLTGIDLEVDVELAFAVEGTDGLGGALLAVALGPDLVVGVRVELTEAIRPGFVSDIALDRQRTGVLQVDDNAFERSVRFVRDPALNGPLDGAPLLRLNGSQAYPSDCG